MNLTNKKVFWAVENLVNKVWLVCFFVLFSPKFFRQKILLRQKSALIPYL